MVLHSQVHTKPCRSIGGQTSHVPADRKIPQRPFSHIGKKIQRRGAKHQQDSRRRTEPNNEPTGRAALVLIHQNYSQARTEDPGPGSHKHQKEDQHQHRRDQEGKNWSHFFTPRPILPIFFRSPFRVPQSKLQAPRSLADLTLAALLPPTSLSLSSVSCQFVQNFLIDKHTQKHSSHRLDFTSHLHHN